MLLLGGCARDSLVSTTLNTVAAGNWQIEKQIDRPTGASISSASWAARSSHTNEPFLKNALLQLVCFKDEPIVRIAFDVTIGSTCNSELGCRFDEKPGHQPGVRFLHDFKNAVIDQPDDVRTFIDELQTSQTLYVRIRSLKAGRTAVAAAYAGRTIKPPEPTKPAKPAKSKRRS